MIEITEQGTTVIVEVAEGIKGDNGSSAYEIALDNGFVGNESEWLASLQGADGENAIAINTAFVNKAYSDIMNIAHDSDNPNFEIDITGNLNLTVTGTVNGDSGMVNLYFSGTEVATINGVKGLSLTGTGVMIPIYFIHDSDGIRWYDGREGAAQDLSAFPKYIIKDLTPSASHTGTTVQTVVKSYLIPANTFSANDTLVIQDLKVTRTGVGGVINYRVRINTVNDISGSVLIASKILTSGQVYTAITRYFTITDGLIKGLNNALSFSTDKVDSAQPMSSTAIDVTSNFYILITAQLDNSADTTIIQDFIVSK